MYYVCFILVIRTLLNNKIKFQNLISVKKINIYRIYFILMRVQYTVSTLVYSKNGLSIFHLFFVCSPFSFFFFFSVVVHLFLFSSPVLLILLTTVQTLELSRRIGMVKAMKLLRELVSNETKHKIRCLILVPCPAFVFRMASGINLMVNARFSNLYY